MTIELHWWMVPLAFFIGYVAFGIYHIRRGSPFNIIPGLLATWCLIAALSFLAGHYV